MKSKAGDPDHQHGASCHPFALAHPVAERVVDRPPTVHSDEQDAEEGHVQKGAPQREVNLATNALQRPRTLYLHEKEKRKSPMSTPP